MIGFFDIEVNVNSKKIEKLGCVFDNDDGYESSSVTYILEIFKQKKPKFICGHNFIKHDKVFLSNTSFALIFKEVKIIDTLYISMLLYPHKKTHKLQKPYKNYEVNIENQPLGDAIQTRELLNLMDIKFENLDNDLKNIYLNLLFFSEYFNGYFEYKKLSFIKIDIYEMLKDEISCEYAKFHKILEENPVELAYIIAFLKTDKKAAISSALLNFFPKIPEILEQICFDEKNIKLEEFAKNEFGISSFREFEDPLNPLFKISQKDIIEKAMDKNESILAILPTGGGKTFTFLMPALMKANICKSLSVVISPLQALMKDQVDSFANKNQNYNVAAISGFLSPIERLNTLNAVERGIIDVLYLAPEALRSNVIFSTLKKRIIERFIIDEAHCFSSWGHDFRQDYYFIAHTIKELENSPYQHKIAVSCFSATAKKEVIKDIKEYFFKHLNINLEEFIASSERKNLDYKVIEVFDKNDKYNELIKILSQNGKSPTIIYLPQNAKGCKKLSEDLKNDMRFLSLNLVVEPFYSKIDDEIKLKDRFGLNKAEILEAFLQDKIDIIIATTAFGMGIDKPNIKNVIHYEQSDSLESYLQESGRGARDASICANCIVLYDRNDFNRNFLSLTKGKVDYHEITSVVKELKKMPTDFLYLSPKQIAKQMGIDTEDSSKDYESIIKTAILELEMADIIKRGRNKTQIFATSIDEDKRSMDYIHQILDAKKEEYGKVYEYMIEIMQNIIQRSKVDAIEIEDFSKIIGIDKKDVFEALYSLQKEGLLEFQNDISANVKSDILNEIKEHFKQENIIFSYLCNNYSPLNLKELNNFDEFNKNLENIKFAKQIIKSWTHLSKLQLNIFNANFKNHICFFEIEKDNLKKLEKLIKIRQYFCIEFANKLLEILNHEKEKEIEFCSNKVLNELNSKRKLSIEAFHHSIVYLNELTKSFQLRRGRLIYYQAFSIIKCDNIKNPKPYQKQMHYNKSLKEYYTRKIESIHILMGFFDKILKEGWKKSKEFASDYFSLDYSNFKAKYHFKKEEIKRALTKEKFEKIIRNLNDEQSQILNDKKSNVIMIQAGPGSGKTKTLVHKIASLITLEGHKSEYFLMLAHSRSAVGEFKTRLKDLIGNLAFDVQISTFHSYALFLLGKNIKDESYLKDVIKEATNLLNQNKIHIPYTQMLVLDEYQDVGEKTYSFISAIYNQMSDDRKIILALDDDQCINNFGEDRADIAYIHKFEEEFSSKEEEKYIFSKYNLLTNYRSHKKIVNFANEYAKCLKNRLKTENLLANSSNLGKISLNIYKNSNYYENLIKQILEDESDTIAILARNNEEVLQIYSSLSLAKINAKYINQKDGFELGNLEELRYFCEAFKNSNDENAFEMAVLSLSENYKNSSNLTLAKKVIYKFQNENGEENIANSPSYYQKIFEEYLSEIKFDEFIDSKIIISTIHKSKGKEFDSVYLCLNDNLLQNEYDKRLLYVAITRAKKSLSLHVKNDIFKNYYAFFDEIKYHDEKLEEPKSLVFEMGLKDIFLSNEKAVYGINKTKPVAGEIVEICYNEGKFCIYKNNLQIARLSKPKENNILAKILQKHSSYKLRKNAQIEFIIIWKNKENGANYKQILCKIFMDKIS